MRFALYIAALVLAVTAAAAQYFFRPNLPPQTVIGNPNSVYAPAQSLPFETVITDFQNDTLLNPTLPSSVDFNNLPPQTVIGNGTSSPGALGFITFSKLKTLSQQSGLPETVYGNYDPTYVPGYTVIGNLSSTNAALALPVSLGNFFNAPVTGCTSQLILNFTITCTFMNQFVF